MSCRGPFVLLALLTASCSSIATITLPSGATAYPFECSQLAQCEESARRICKRLDYFVHEKTEIRPQLVDTKPPDWGGAGSVGEIRTGSKMPTFEKQPYWRLVVECEPPEATIHSRVDIHNNAAEFERSKAEFVAAVCKLRDPELRRKELQIARQDYGSVTCD